MKKLLTLTLSLLMAFSLCLTVSADNAYVAQVGECDDESCKYTTLQAAINAAVDNVETEIDLVAECEEITSEPSGYIVIPSTKNIVLDLNGKEITINGIRCNGKLKVINSKFSENEDENEDGTIILNDIETHEGSAHIRAVEGGTFTLVSGGIQNECDGTSFVIAAEGNPYQEVKSTVNLASNLKAGGVSSMKESIAIAAGKGATVNVTGGLLYTQNNTVFSVKNGANPIKAEGGAYLYNENSNISEYLASGYKLVRQQVNAVDAYVVAVNNTNTNTDTNTTSFKSYDAKDKNQDGIITCDEEMDNPNWVWSTTKGACVYSVTNTSVR